MSKTIAQIEARLERLEKELAEVKAALARKPGMSWYRQTLGDFGDVARAEAKKAVQQATQRMLRNPTSREIVAEEVAENEQALEEVAKSKKAREVVAKEMSDDELLAEMKRRGLVR